ncbi:bifunctional diguanylate cyclase/phosphodiesterase [Alteromonas sp.]|uniref:bifunctional diguanylate cyclase/phosphodiesterase n=1 Tax=Alteromonas sp. TaxID=232 RepID=UPI00257D1DD3|nr:GGDEF domain-containing phosphodiesterase [Alteromonas sp.]NQY18813.1 EAL domain-containing protein [Alteromonas sp.]
MDLRSERMLSTVRAIQRSIADLLNENRAKTEALSIALASINPNSGRATVVATDKNHTLVDAESIVFPSHVLLMLPLTPLSAPIPASEFVLPQSFTQFADNHIVVAMIRDMQNEVMGVVLIFVSNSVLTAQQHDYIDIMRQKIEVCYQYDLIRHPYSDKLSEQLSLLEEVSAISKVGAWELDRATGVFAATEVTRNLLGIRRVKSVNLNEILDTMVPSERAALKYKVFKAMKGERQFVRHIDIKDKQGRTKNVKLTIFLQVQRMESGALKLTRLFGVIQDETDVQRLSDSQHDYTDYVVSLLNSVDSIVLSIDENGTILSANECVTKVLGFEPDDLIGQDVKLIATKVQNSDIPSYFLNLDAGLKICADGGAVRECLRHKNGKRISCEVSFTMCIVHEQKLVVATIRDVTTQRYEIEHFKQLALTDAVTGLPNLNKFEHYLAEKAHEDKSAKPFSVFMRVSVRNIKEYEDAYGEPTIDYLLRILASRFVRTFETNNSGNASVFKCDSANFFLHLHQDFNEEGQSINAAKAYAQLIQEQVLAPITLHNSLLTIETQTISCTVPIKYFSFKKIRELLSRKPLREINDSNSASLTHDYFHINASDIERYNYIKHSLSRAISNNELFVQLQPQYDGQGSVISSEVLLRWQHPHLGMVKPSEFIPIAEENEFIAEFGLWVCNEACRLLSDCQSQHIDTKLSVNISAKHLARADFVSKFVGIVNRWQISHSKLTLELTEGALIRGVSIIQYRVRELAEQGFSLSIDDFGIGDSNLNYLQDLPIKELKVDRVFIEAMEASQQKTLLVTSICNMAKALHLGTVAEGIETTQQLDQAKACGCSAFQGYYLDKPMNVEDWFKKVVGQKV